MPLRTSSALASVHSLLYVDIKSVANSSMPSNTFDRPNFSKASVGKLTKGSIVGAVGIADLRETFYQRRTAMVSVIPVGKVRIEL
jgi:hypothetical protein